MSEHGTRIPLPALLRPRLQAFRSGESPDADVRLQDPRTDQEHWLKPEQFFVLEALAENQTHAALAGAMQARFGREMARDEVERLLANIANLGMVARASESHPLLAPYFAADSAVAGGASDPAPAARANEAAAAGAGPSPAAAPAAPPSRPDGAATPDVAPTRGGVRDVLGLDETVKRISFALFDPRPLLQRLLPLVLPLRHLVYAVPLLLLASVGVALRYADLIQQDSTRLLAGTSLVEHLLLGLITVNFVVTACTAFVAQRYRATVSSIDLVLALGFVPRLVPKIGHVEQLQKRELMWLHGAPLLTRLSLFALAILVWYAERATNGTLAVFGLSLAVVCAASFLFSANPLAKGSGYQLLATLLEEPNLRGKSVTAFFGLVRGRRHVGGGSEVLAAYALASALFMVFAIIFVVQILASWLQFQMGAGGVLVVVVLAGFLLARTVSKLRRIGQSLERAEQLDRWRNRTLHKREDDEPAKKTPASRRFALRAGLLLALVLLFLPYPYEPSGEFVIIPSKRQAITSDVSGTIEEVYFDGGERLEQGTVLARLSSHGQLSEMMSAEARMAENQAVVAELRARPRPEEVELARAGLKVARIRAEFSKADHLRLKALFESTAGSLDEVETARRQYEVDVARIDEAKAELSLVEAGAPPDEIRGAEAKVERWRVERDEFADRVERASLRMPFDGQLVTLHLKHRRGEFLEPGDAFAYAENNREVLARIDVPESDIAHVLEGGEVELRTWAHYDAPVLGEIVEVEANVEDESFGKFVTVITRLDNADGRLKAGMTGFAKIEGGSQPVWRVFSRALVRFVLVEAWSWIP